MLEDEESRPSLLCSVLPESKSGDLILIQKAEARKVGDTDGMAWLMGGFDQLGDEMMGGV